MIVTSQNPAQSDRRSTEIDYQKRLNVGIVGFILPVFLFLAVFNFYREAYLQALIFTALILNASAAFILMLRLPLERMVRVRNITVWIAFFLMAVSILMGLVSGDTYMVLPYIFSYPLALTLFFGPRTGFVASAVFCAMAGVAIIAIDFAPWTPSNIIVFKTHLTIELVIMLAIALISEKARVRIRDKLIRARNKYKAAEERQRETNRELKSEIELRIRSEKALAHSEQRYRSLFEDSAVPLWEEDWTGVKVFLDDLPLEAARDLSAHFKQNPGDLKHCIGCMEVTAVNRATLTLTEADTIQTLLKNVDKVLPRNAADYLADRMISLYETGRYDAELTTRSINGHRHHVMISCTVPSGYQSSWQRIFTSVNDVTEKVAMAEEKERIDRQLRHSQQFQAIATLAGGISHRFNNALAAIVGNLDLLDLKIAEENNARHHIQSLRHSAKTISNLTEQLLAYARGGKYQPKELSVNALIDELLRNDETVSKARSRITTCFDKSVDLTVGDVTQIRIVMEQVLANAIEATTEAGEITVSTWNRDIAVDGDDAGTELNSGPYVAICFEDSGVGMDAQTCRRVFEPFFSTKFVGRGLGMAAAFGIVMNHNGAITVTSEAGVGTRVTIYLPAGSDEA